MRKDWETPLERWTSAGLIDHATGRRIREFEEARTPAQGLRWPILVALGFGTILLAAGILLFVSAHWDQLSPAERMTVVVLIIAVFHAGGAAAAGRFESLSISLHAIGTIALGAGIALAGQIYHLSEHWSSAILLWAVGAAIAWGLLGQWPQAALTAVLAPCWAASEWWLDAIHLSERRVPVAVGLCALAFTYLTAPQGDQDSPIRRALEFLGGAALIPTAVWVAVPQSSPPGSFDWPSNLLPTLVAIVMPLALAFVLRRQAAVWNLGAARWVVLLAVFSVAKLDLSIYFWCFVGCVGLAFWGIREQRAERVNLAFLGFAVTVLVFYFSDVMAKLDRALSLILLGVLFLGGGWLLERTRRKIIARMRTKPA
jgi:uncharacterized membrane protein